VLARPDLAELALEGLAPAAAYRPTEAHQCVVAAAALREAPDAAAPQQDQLVFGEVFDVLEARDGWLWGRARRDGYVGFVRVEALVSGVKVPTHRVSALRTYAYAAPDLRGEPVMLLSLNALVTAGERSGRFVHIAGAGWVAESDLADFLHFDAEPAAVAERFVGTPYQWGGRESLGLDSSALVQQALYACGKGCPRETGEQADIGAPVAPEALRRNDLVFWPGHVAVLLDSSTVVHADAHHMAVAVEPLAEVIARQRAEGAGEPMFRRLAA
jgi:cell wall-associated NlpC family hydrolase